MSKSTWIIVWLCVRLLSATSLSQAAEFGVSAGEDVAALTLRPTVFVSAKGDCVEAEWGVLRVPENRADPTSHRIELAFVRFKSTAERRFI